jgi:hypothetical protein
MVRHHTAKPSGRRTAMTTTDEPAAADVPAAEEAPELTPGSPAAREAGCVCPAWMNTYGAGVRTGYGADEPGTFLVHPVCRLHGSDALCG